MKPINLTAQEQQQVSNLAKEIRKSSLAELDKNRTREDFYGLFSDIVQELAKNCNSKIDLLYDFAELLDEKIRLTPPEMAFIYGKMAKQKGQDLNQSFLVYLDAAANAIVSSGIIKRLEEAEVKLCVALGDAYGLLADFILLHAQVVEYIKPQLFYKLGYSNAEINTD